MEELAKKAGNKVFGCPTITYQSPEALERSRRKIVHAVPNDISVSHAHLRKAASFDAFLLPESIDCRETDP